MCADKPAICNISDQIFFGVWLRVHPTKYLNANKILHLNIYSLFRGVVKGQEKSMLGYVKWYNNQHTIAQH